MPQEEVMKTYTMTETETCGWNSNDTSTREHVRHDVRAKAAMKTARNDACEIRSPDGIAMDVVEGT
jgi:hypothetical protein